MIQLSAEQIEQYDTPFYLFDADHLSSQIKVIHEVFETYWNNYIIAYSVKTNPLPALCRFMMEKEIYAEVVSKNEYELVTECGYNDGQIVVNGPIKGKDWLNHLISKVAIINIDSWSEVDSICQIALDNPKIDIKIGIRVNIYLEDLFPNSSTAGSRGSRFGFCDENGDLLLLLERFKQYSNIKIVGLHLHTSTNLRSLDIYKLLCQRFAEIVSKYNLNDIEYFDIGGGYFGELPNKPGWNDYIECISKELRKYGFSSDVLTLIIEPGVSMISGCFSYFSRVVETKNTIKSCFVQMDGTRLHIDPLLHKTNSSLFFNVLRKNVSDNISTVPVQELTGATCLEYDTLYVLNDSKQLFKGDIVQFNKVGAYTMSFTPLFINWYPTVLMYRNGDISVVRERWTTQEVLQKSVYLQ